MACDKEQEAIDKAIAAATKDMEAEMAQIAADAKSKSSKLESDFDSTQDMSAGIGAAAGTAIGAAVGGVGAPVGAVIGEQIGRLVIVEIRQKTVKMSTDVPEFKNGRQEIVISVPAVTMKNDDIVFSKPEIVMVRHRGPNVPNGIRCRRLKCTPIYKETWYKRPEMKMVEHRIVIGVPQFTMQKKTIALNVPQVAMRRREISFSIPQITLRFVQDAGRKLASAAGDIARDAEAASADAESRFKARLKSEVSGPLMELFECNKRDVKSQMDAVAKEVDGEIAKLSDSLTALASKGVPETDDDYVAVKQALEKAAKARVEIVKPWQDALDQLDKEMAAALEEFAKA